jgi:nitrate/nitrite transporter NarK
VVWYAGQFYALFYMQTVLKVNARTANIIIAIALVIGMPFFTVVGALSDRIGRKKLLMMAYCLLAVITYIPIYEAMERAAGNNVVTVHSVRNKVTGAIALIAMTTDASGALVPAKEARKSQYRHAGVTGFRSGALCVPGVWSHCRLFD